MRILRHTQQELQLDRSGAYSPIFNGATNLLAEDHGDLSLMIHVPILDLDQRVVRVSFS